MFHRFYIKIRLEVADLKIFAVQKKEKYIKLITRCVYDIYFRRFNVRWDIKGKKKGKYGTCTNHATEDEHENR